jgi:hypothetical protein
VGGYGSTRWGWYSKRLAVEDCRRLPFRMFKKNLLVGWSGQITWSRNGEVISTIGYQVKGSDCPSNILLIYTITRADGEKIDCKYPIDLTTTPLPWGGLRYWFVCPIAGCGRRVNVLYLAPGGKYFACRHCYRLSYRSRQEGYQDRVFYGHMAEMMRDLYPSVTGVTWRHVREFWKAK